MEMEWDYIFELLLPLGLLFISQVVYEYGVWWNDIEILTRENQRTWRQTNLSATLSTTNPTWADQGMNQGLHSERPATNLLSHGTVTHYHYFMHSAFVSQPDTWNSQVTFLSTILRN
jgi:hypothetical protein